MPSQIVATVPLLEGLDGVEKMSKSKGNYVGITEPPADMFRKLMNISDTLIWRYYELLTDFSLEEIAQIRADAESARCEEESCETDRGRLPLSRRSRACRVRLGRFATRRDAGPLSRSPIRA